jgi:HlyD family secretion protein
MNKRSGELMKKIFQVKQYSKKKKIVSAIALVVVLLISATILKSTVFKANEVDAAAEFQEYVVSETNLSQTYSTSGNVGSKVDKTVIAPFSSDSFIFEVEVGDIVKAGDLIGTFDASDIKVALLNQEKTVLNQEYQMEQLKNEGNKSYLSSLESSKINYESAQKTYDMNLELFKSGGISQTELDSSKDALNNAYNSYDVERGQYYGFDLENEIEMLEKSLEVEQITLSKLQSDFEDVELRAEFSGTIVDSFVENGDPVSNGEDIYQIMDLNALEIISQISEYEINDLGEGQSVIITIMGDETSISKGVISKVYPSGVISSSEVSIKTVIDIVKADEKLIPGFSTNLEIIIASKENALVVPYDALVKTPTGYSVIKLTNGEEKIIPVMTGVESDLMIEIISEEIAAGDTVKVMSSIDFSSVQKNGGMMIPGAGKGAGVRK